MPKTTQEIINENIPYTLWYSQDDIEKLKNELRYLISNKVTSFESGFIKDFDSVFDKFMKW
jgi:hypothetical protein